MVPAGHDSFRDIGRPRGIVDGNVEAGLQEWKELHEKFFPATQAAGGKAAKFVIDDRYREAGERKKRQSCLTVSVCNGKWKGCTSLILCPCSYHTHTYA